MKRSFFLSLLFLSFIVMPQASAQTSPASNADGPNVVAGSDLNAAAPGVVGATISGGGDPEENGTAQPNQVTERYGTVGGGAGNTAGEHATVGGGRLNKAAGRWSTVGGGKNNVATGFRATICGGEDNRAPGSGATVPGGVNNRANGDFSFAAGTNTRAEHRGAFVWSDFTPETFASTAENQFLIRAHGGVGIGTSQPREDLHLLDPDRSSVLFLGGGGTIGPHGLVFDDDTEGQGVQLFWRTDPNRLILERSSGGSTRNGDDAFFYDRDDEVFFFRGRVGIGTATPSAALQVRGRIEAADFVQNSDGRYKEQVAPITGALEAVSRLRGVEFAWKHGMFPGEPLLAGRQLGFVAQEVAGVLPEAVHQDAAGRYAVSYGQMIPLLVEAVKAQQAEIEQLRREQAALRAAHR